MDWNIFKRFRHNYIVVLACFLLMWLLIISIAASKVVAARQETNTLREQLAETKVLLAEAVEQKILVIEPSTPNQEAETTHDKAFEADSTTKTVAQSTTQTVASATRKDDVPTDTEIVRPAESLPDATLLGRYLLSYYCPCKKCTNKTPDNPEYGITATGHAAIPYRTVAVDPSIIPYGTTLYIDYGDGVMRECIADDCGGDIKGHRLDLYVGDHQEALRLGKRWADVYLWRSEE